MELEKRRSKFLIPLLYSAAILGMVFFMWNGQRTVRTGGGAGLYRNLMEAPAWVRRGFDPAELRRLPEAGPDWYRFDTRPLRIMDSPLPDLPRRPFLSPRGREAEEFTILIGLELDAAFMSGLAGPGVSPGLSFACIGENWEIYLNGTLLRSELRLDGDGKIRSPRTWRDVYFPVERALLYEGANILALRIIGDPAYDATGLYYMSPYYLDDFRIIEERQRSPLLMVLCGVFGFTGIYHLMLFFSVRRKRESFNLYYSIFSFLLCCYSVVRNGVINILIPHSGIAVRLEYICLFMGIPMLGSFIEILGRQRASVITRIYTGLCLALSLTQMFFCNQYGDDALKIWNVATQIYMPYVVFYNVLYLYFSKRGGKGIQRSPDEIRALAPLTNILIGTAMVYVCGVFELIDVLIFHLSFNLFQYSTFVFHIGVAFTLSERFNELYNQLEQSNAVLETAVRERTAELEKQTGIAVEASRAKSEFLAAMSHEIRTPLNAVIGLSEIELRGELSPKSKNNIEQIYQSGSALLGIVNDILDISKIEAGGMELIPVDYEAAPFINDTVHLNMVRIGSKPVVFVLEIGGDFPRKLRGDELRVRQILNNLLSNAFKYTPEGRVTLSALWEDRGDTALLRFSVRDTGIGIRPEDLGKLFSDYAQLDTRANRKIEGTGLGLAISRRLVEMMGGRIAVESEYGKGSVFTAELVQGIVEREPIGEETARSLRTFRYVSAGKERNLARSWMPYGKVLVVDDLPVNLQVARGLLEPYGLRVDTALSGREAVELVKQERPPYDLVFMDHMMPEMDGIEAAAHIRAWEEQRGESSETGVPLIALTANALAGNMEMFLSKGFNGFISKPIDLAQLDEILNRWVRDLREGAEGPVRDAPGEAEPGEPEGFPEIPGVDVKTGIALTGGTPEAYRRVLALFCRDAEDRLPRLRETPEGAALPGFTTQVHALKSAAASLGAGAVSAEAARLEAAGKAGDLLLIREALPGFAASLAELASGIRAALEGSADPAAGDKAGTLGLAPFFPLFRELQRALENRRLDTIDRLLDDLNRQIPDPRGREKLEEIADEVLAAEYGKAAGIIRGLLEKVE
jgi:signal transduction histidine kinase/CheY-like chemotaxis protein